MALRARRTIVATAVGTLLVGRTPMISYLATATIGEFDVDWRAAMSAGATAQAPAYAVRVLSGAAVGTR